MDKLEDKKDSNGNIRIKGNLYITDKYDINSLSDEGIIYAKDCFFECIKDEQILHKNDIFIENLFEKVKVNNIVLY